MRVVLELLSYTDKAKQRAEKVDAIAPRLGANCPTAGAGRLLDLNPPAACTTNDRCDTGSNCLCRGSQWTSDGLRRYGPNGITNVIPYADIISGGWQHARASSPAMIATAARPVSLADVAVGMPVAGTWVLASNNAEESSSALPREQRLRFLHASIIADSLESLAKCSSDMLTNAHRDSLLRHVCAKVDVKY